MKLYSLNTPCWSDYDSKNTAGSSLIHDPLSDHFTFMFYNFMKYGLVDEVIVFLEEKRIKRGIVNSRIETDAGNMTIIPAAQIPNIDLEKDQIVYCWSRWEECHQLKDNFVIVNPMFSNRMYPSCLDKNVHDHALIEGSAYKDTVPPWMNYDVFRYTTKDFCEITKAERENTEKHYDWIMVSSFDPRKRHVEFLQELTRHKDKPLKGCIVGRSPDNKGHRHSGHKVLETILQIKQDENLDIDVYLNVSQEEKKNLMLKSKVFVCASSLDNGPRAMVEATQAGLPLISMPHIGSSDLITNTTGELVRDFHDFPDALFYALENIKKYDKHYNSNMLATDVVYPSLIQKIREIKDGSK